ILNSVTGVCGLAAMLWLYGVAWHQPMAESIAWARTTLAEALPSPGRLTGGLAANAGRIGMLTLPGTTSPDARSTPSPATAPGSNSGAGTAPPPTVVPAPVEPVSRNALDPDV